MDEGDTKNKAQSSEEAASQQSASAGPGKQPQAPQTDKGSEENFDNVKTVAAVAYLGITFFVPLLTNPESDFARFHANQGLLLLITGTVVNILGGMLMVVLIGLVILPLGNLFVLILFIMGLINAMNGEKKPLPLIGGIQLIK